MHFYVQSIKVFTVIGYINCVLQCHSNYPWKSCIKTGATARFRMQVALVEAEWNLRSL